MFLPFSSTHKNLSTLRTEVLSLGLTDLSSYAWNSYSFFPGEAAALTLITVPHPGFGEQLFRLPP